MSTNSNGNKSGHWKTTIKGNVSFFLIYENCWKSESENQNFLQPNSSNAAFSRNTWRTTSLVKIFVTWSHFLTSLLYYIILYYMYLYIVFICFKKTTLGCVAEATEPLWLVDRFVQSLPSSAGSRWVFTHNSKPSKSEKNSLAKLHIRVKRETRNLSGIRLPPITNAALAADSAGAGRRRSSVDISHQRLFFSETPKGRRRVQSSRKSSEQLTAAQRWLPWSLHWLETRRRYL